MSYYCEVCDKLYKSSKSLWTHKYTYHSSNKTVNKSIKKEKKIIKCKYCDRKFNNYGNLNKHNKICKHKESSQEQQLSNIIQESLPIVLKLLQENFSKLNPNSQGNQISEQNGNHNNSNNSISSHNINSNSLNPSNSHNTNNINIVSLGKENIPDILSINEQLNILKNKQDALSALIKHVHFNKKFPHFHNIAIDDNKGYIYDESGMKFKEVPKGSLIHDVMQTRIDDIYDINENNKGRASNKTYQTINNILPKFSQINYYQKYANDKIEPIISSGTEYLLDKKYITIETD